MFDAATVQLSALEAALVRQFRLMQALGALTRSEREALAAGDVAALEDLLAQKAQLQVELDRLDGMRVAALEAWAQASGWPEAQMALADMLAHLRPPVAERLGHLRQGILALAGEIGELTRGNRALAASALERVGAVREFLIGLERPAEGYQPWGAAPAPARSSASLTLEQWA